MPDRMERFTQRARRALALAHEEAERLKHNYIGSEHLLIGLVREEGGIAASVLRELGLELERVKEMVERLSGVGSNVGGRIEMDPEAEQVLQASIEEARRMGHHFIGTEHLLLGMVRHGENKGMEILRRLGITTEQIRRQTRRELQERPSRHVGRVRRAVAPRRQDYAVQLAEVLDAALEEQRLELMRQWRDPWPDVTKPVAEPPSEVLKRVNKIIRKLKRFQRALRHRNGYEGMPEDARNLLEQALSELQDLTLYIDPTEE